MNVQFLHEMRPCTVYTHQDYASLCAQKNKRLLLLLVPCLLLLGAVIYSFVIRVQWLTTLLTIVLGTVLLFGYTMFLAPVIAYLNHVDHALNGKVRQTTGWLKEVEEAAVWREGLEVIPLMININRMENEEDDRLFYWDARRPLPPWHLGGQVTLTSYDKLITDWKEEV